MRTIIAGSRGIYGAQALQLIGRGVTLMGVMPTVVISGCARGVDTAGEEWAKARGIPVERYPADWDRYGRSAGFHRNAEMAKVAHALIAVWDGVSRGTAHMIQEARRRDCVVHIVRVPPTK